MRARSNIGADGAARSRGRARDGTSSTTLVAERSPARASCADVDGDGTGGLTRLTFALRDARPGERFTTTLLPDGGEADEASPQAATMVLDGRLAASRRPGRCGSGDASADAGRRTLNPRLTGQ